MGKQSQLLLQPTEVELGLQVGVEFDNIISNNKQGYNNNINYNNNNNKNNNNNNNNVNNNYYNKRTSI